MNPNLIGFCTRRGETQGCPVSSREVHGGRPRRDFSFNSGNLSQREPGRRVPYSDGPAFDVCNADEDLPVNIIDRVNVANIGVNERSDRLRLAESAGVIFLASQSRRGKEFPGYRSLEPGVFGFVHYAQAAPAEFGQGVVVADSAADMHDVAIVALWGH